MTPIRVLILLVVLVAVLFAVSLALAGRNSGQRVDPARSWLTNLTSSKPLAPSDVWASNGWANGQWTIPGNVGLASLEIGTNKSNRPRRVKLSLGDASVFRVEFLPRLDKDHPGKFVDGEAMPLKIKEFKSGQPVELTILKHGGSLVVTRLAGTGSAVFKLE
jgi:hypothetical protein